MKVIVTGASGLIGRAAVTALRARGHDVITLDRVKGADASSIACDLERPIDPAALPARFDAVVHLAQGRGHRDFPASAAALFGVNTRTTAELLELARVRGARAFVLASTGSVYAPGVGLREDAPTPVAHEAYYAATKRAAELVALGYGQLVNVQVLRFFSVYGAEQRADMMMPRLVRAVIAQEEIAIDGPTGPMLTPTHVSDAARVVVTALGQQGSAITNVAGPETLSLADVVATLGEVAGVRPRVRHTDKVPLHVVPDLSAMTTRYGAGATRLRDGVREMLSSAGAR